MDVADIAVAGKNNNALRMVLDELVERIEALELVKRIEALEST